MEHMATSYVSEHSVEYSIVLHLKPLLEQHFDYVVPLYPWVSRELGNTSKNLHQNDLFFIFVVFPRRPKITEKSNICITINDHLKAFKRVGEDYGINTIAGCPIATNFWELSKCTEIAWINIDHPNTNEYLINVPNNKEQRLKDNLFITVDQILLTIKEHSKLQTIHSLEAFLREARNATFDTSDSTSFFSSFFGNQYKPIYFLIKSD
jgi:hypothetical protein